MDALLFIGLLFTLLVTSRGDRLPLILGCWALALGATCLLLAHHITSALHLAF